MASNQDIYVVYAKNWESFENVDSTITPEHYYNNTEQYQDTVMVVNGDKLKYMNITPLAMECFRYSFGGTVCDSTQWRYYRICLNHAVWTTKSDKSILDAVKLEYL